MKTHNTHIIVVTLVLVSVFLSGCYTQLKTSVKYEQEYQNEYVVLKKAGIFYKDYSKEMWYKERFLDKVNWTGTDSTKNYSAKSNTLNRTTRNSEYASAFPGWYSNPHRYHRHYIWGEGFGMAFGPLYWAYRLDSGRAYGNSHSGHWYYNPPGFWSYYYYPYSTSFHDPYYYDSYWGTTGYWGMGNFAVAEYNNHTRARNYTENSRKYRLGPRNTGLVYEVSQRTRSNSSAVSRTRGVTRSSSEDTRVRSTGSSTGSTTRSTGRSRSSGDGDSSSRSRGGN
jgi:hypothetical protein